MAVPAVEIVLSVDENKKHARTPSAKEGEEALRPRGPLGLATRVEERNAATTCCSLPTRIVAPGDPDLLVYFSRCLTSTETVRLIRNRMIVILFFLFFSSMVLDVHRNHKAD